MTIKLNDQSKLKSKQLSSALARGDADAVSSAMQGFCDAVADDCREQYEQAVASEDSRVMSQRGFRQLTADENKYYQSVIGALKSDAPRQEFAKLPDHAMPTTIISDVLQNLQDNHPLLKAVNITPTSYLTEWVANDSGVDTAAWGDIDSDITKEITGAFKVIDVKQAKVSAFAVVSRGMLDLGPVWLDGYVRTVLSEALANALEYGVVRGTGANGEPVGLDRDIHEGVSVSTTTGYPQKTAVKISDLTPKTYGDLISKLTKTEKGLNKNIDPNSIALICSPADYYSKIMPATTVLTTSGAYATNVLPIQTQVIPSNACEDGKAVLALMNEYRMFVGGDRGIEFSDEAQFVQDKRAFKIVEYAAGSAIDNTSAILLDISNIDPAYLNVKVANQAQTASK